MCEGFGIDMPRTHTLQPVVPNRGSRLHCCLDITRVKQVALIGRVRPYSGKTIRLQFDPHRYGFGRLRITFLCRPRFCFNPH